MVDCGISFADDYLPGIDLIMPNIEFLDNIKDDVRKRSKNYTEWFKIIMDNYYTQLKKI